jgi:hypothetical protein
MDPVEKLKKSLSRAEGELERANELIDSLDEAISALQKEILKKKKDKDEARLRELKAERREIDARRDKLKAEIAELDISIQRASIKDEGARRQLDEDLKTAKSVRWNMAALAGALPAPSAVTFGSSKAGPSSQPSASTAPMAPRKTKMTFSGAESAVSKSLFRRYCVEPSGPLGDLNPVQGIEPFQWVVGRREDQLKDEYLAWWRRSFPAPELLGHHRQKKGTLTATVHKISLHGESDIVTTWADGSQSLVICRNAIFISVEIKTQERLEADRDKYERQAMLELLAAAHLSFAPPLVVLTDFNDEWTFFWLEDCKDEDGKDGTGKPKIARHAENSLGMGAAFLRRVMADLAEVVVGNYKTRRYFPPRSTLVIQASPSSSYSDSTGDVEDDGGASLFDVMPRNEASYYLHRQALLQTLGPPPEEDSSSDE